MKEVIAIQTLGTLERRFFNYLKTHPLTEEIKTAELHVCGIAMQTFYLGALIFHLVGLALCFIVAAHPPVIYGVLFILTLTLCVTFFLHLYYKYAFKPAMIEESKYTPNK